MSAVGHLAGGFVVEWDGNTVADDDVTLTAAVIDVRDHVEMLTLHFYR